MTMFLVERSAMTIEGAIVSTDDFIFPIIGATKEAEGASVFFDMTGFTITNAPVLITAGHLADIFQDLKPREHVLPNLDRRPLAELQTNKAPMIVRTTAEDKRRGRVHALGEGIFWRDFDIMVLPILGPFAPTPHIPIVEEPEIGLKVSAHGFPKIWQNVTRMAGEVQIKKYFGSSDGKITELHPNGGYHGLWYPGITSTAGTPGGMSGGPIGRKKDFAVIGVNSYSLTDGESYCAWIGRALDRVFNLSYFILYEDGTKFNLDAFTLRALHDFGKTKVGQNHELIQMSGI